MISDCEFYPGQDVEVRVPCKNDGSMNWLPGTVQKVSDSAIFVKRRGNKLEKMGAILLGFEGDTFAVSRWYGDPSVNIRHASAPPKLGSTELEKRAMRSAIAWYVEYMERERDGCGQV